MNLPKEQESKLALLQKHVAAELAGDLETTMATMTENPHLINVPTKVGGVGREGVRSFYRDHLVGKFFPPDVKIINVSILPVHGLDQPAIWVMSDKSLKTTLKAEIDQDAWESLNSDTSRPFPKPTTGRIAVKVINHLGDEVMKVFSVE
jgi:hypothetical protein